MKGILAALEIFADFRVACDVRDQEHRAICWDIFIAEKSETLQYIPYHTMESLNHLKPLVAHLLLLLCPGLDAVPEPVLEYLASLYSLQIFHIFWSNPRDILSMPSNMRMLGCFTLRPFMICVRWVTLIPIRHVLDSVRSVESAISLDYSRHAIAWHAFNGWDCIRQNERSQSREPSLGSQPNLSKPDKDTV